MAAACQTASPAIAHLAKERVGEHANSVPTPATSARLPGAWWIPTSELIFNAEATSTGARNSRLVPMKASVYSEMKPHPTRCAAGDAGSHATSAAVRYLISSSPAVGGRRCCVGPLPTGLEESGIALPFEFGGAAARQMTRPSSSR